MKNAWNWLERGLEWLVAVLMVVVGLPLMAVALFLLRGVLLAAMVVGMAGSFVAYGLSPRFRRWIDGRAERLRPLRVL